MIIPQAYHPMHPMGDSTFAKLECAVDGITGLVYIHVPKNASCWVKYHLDLVGSQPYNYYDQGFDYNKHMALVILRDPFERWVSAMGQILVGNKPDYHMHIDNLDWDHITQEIPRNNHTQPQHEFFANIPHDRITWFRCDHTLKYTFTNCLEQYGIKINVLAEEQDINNIFNVTKKVPEKIINDFAAPPQQTIVDKIRLVLNQRPEYIEKIKKLYKEDYNLFDNAPYYAPR